MRTIGASWSGSIVQLVSRDGSSTRWTVRSARGRGAPDVRGGRRLDRRRRTRSSSGCARPSSRPARPGSARSPASIRSTTTRLLAASTDSVGTKLILARERGALRACGADLAAHCINDVITCGADPLFFLDYVAANRIDLETVAELVEGAAEVCREAGVALIGGETAELPGIYREDELDFAGTCVGLVEREPADRRLACRGRRRGRRASVGRRACERLHARAPRARGRGLHAATTSSRRRGSTSTTCGACATARTRSRT